MPPFGKDKRVLVKDIVFHNYYDLIGEVVKTYYPGSLTMDIYITDYTSHPDLFYYDGPNWPGPEGQWTLPVRLWEPHAQWARENVNPGDIVFLQNVHAKLSQSNKLEGSIHFDQKFPNKVCIRHVKFAGQLEEHNRRKEAYQKSIGAQNMKPNVPKKASARDAAKRREDKKAMDGLQEELEKEEDLDKKKTAEKRARKRERERLQREREQQELEKKLEEQEVARAGINAHIRAVHPDVKLSTIREIVHNPELQYKAREGGIIQLPFVNAKHRTRVRVVDFSPSNILDFARSTTDPSWNKSLPPDRTQDEGEWMWNFVLLVEASNSPSTSDPPFLRLFVNNEAAEHLLNMKACNLRENPAAAAELKHKLSILWGNLLELKNGIGAKGVKFPLPSGDERLKNLPFDCCVEEYGSETSITSQCPTGWQRRHKLFGTRIMDLE